MPCNFLLFRLDNFIESREQVVVDVKQELDAPLFFICQHCLDQLVCFIDDAEVSQLSKRELLGLHECLNDYDCMLVQVCMVNLVEFCDELEHTFLLTIGLDFFHTLATSGLTSYVCLQVS